MRRDLNITLVQSDLHWHDQDVNRDMFSQKIESLSEDTDLIILPEMFTTGFTMEAEQYAEEMDGATLQWMKKMSHKTQAVITGSIIIKEGGSYFNRLIWMRSDGTYDTYDKRHLFAMAGEHEHYTAGQSRLIIDIEGWRICPLVCYDLRFPVWARNNDEYDVLIYTANWPSMRAAHWNKLLVARAIENQSYVAGVNRVGTDGKGYPYDGDSLSLIHI